MAYNAKKHFFPIFEVVATTDLKIEALPVIRLTPNFQELFLSKLNSKSGKMGEKVAFAFRHPQTTDSSILK